MKAADHTTRMLDWWQRAGVDYADLAVRRPDGTMLWHHALHLERLPLPWARVENVRGADVYLRPARGRSWPLVFLDDVPISTARRATRKTHALAVHTSPGGGCHLWVALDRPLDEHQRAVVQRWLVHRIEADPASTSGEHLGRLAGFKNWKRNGTWVNVLEATTSTELWDPSPALALPEHGESNSPQRTMQTRPGESRDLSQSAQEWGWVCGALAAGVNPRSVFEQLATKAETRRGNDAARYADHTVQRAITKLGLPHSLPHGGGARGSSPRSKTRSKGS